MAVRRDSVMAASAAVLLVAAVLVYFFRTGGAIEEPSKTTFHGVCLSCKDEGMRDRYVGDVAPFECRECGKHAVYMWRFCTKCKSRCLPEMEEREPGKWRPPAFPKCPKCGTDIAPYDPDALEFLGIPVDEVGTLPLPSWPFKE